MQRRLVLGLAATGAAALFALAGCANGLLAPKSVNLSERELLSLVDRAFPLDRKLLEVVDVHVDAPRLKLLPERNKLAVDLQLNAADRVFGRAFKGRLAFESGLRFEPSDQSLRLAQVQVNELSLDGGTGGAQALAQRLGAAIAEKVLEGFLLHRLSDERWAQLQKAGVQPGAVRVTGGGLEMALEPIRH
ncbi:hypothetical protein BurJ1DRAFT_2864 [Burkholderiales bacterium JOSHI_001]|nr:hypothetical protein BurJ1DRAFT_2864 [Burkholderiales bacterium JOSHI_001]